MTRVARASLATVFGYLRFGLALAAGLLVVPFVVGELGPRVYGFWLASGEVLGYAAMADFGLLGTMPWLIAEADGRHDRDGVRRLMSTGAGAALMLTIVYAAGVLLLWNVLPSLLRLSPAEREMVLGPFVLVAAVGGIAMPLRLFSVTLAGLQDVKFQGTASACSWAADVALTIVLLQLGYGLYALAAAAAFPGLAAAVAAAIRVRIIAPELMTGWPRPTLTGLSHLFHESIGGWFSQWGWRLTSATDGIILASLGNPIAVTALAMTSRLGNMLMQMSWMPGDSALIGLANLHGEQQPGRLRAAVVGLLRVNIALAGAAVCVVLAANPGFVSWWIPGDVFAGDRVNGLLAVALMLSSITHAVIIVTGVLGRRVLVGVATLSSGVVQAVLAYLLARRFGIAGVVVGSIAAQSLVLLPLLAKAFATMSGVTLLDAVREVGIPLAARSGPLAIVALMVGLWLPAPPGWGIILLGAATGVVYLWLTRSVYLDYPAIQMLLDRFPAWGMPPALRRRLAPKPSTVAR
jgi:O-antigen/teichoic acid export membrane protein